MKKQQDEETARTSTEAAPTPPQEVATLDPQQQEMIEKLVAMQKQCNKRSFLDRPKVTVSVATVTGGPSLHAAGAHLVAACLCLPPAAVAAESGPAEPRGAPAALRPLHRAGHHVGAGDRGFCQAASGFPGAHEGGSDRPAEDVHHRGSRVQNSAGDYQRHSRLFSSCFWGK